MTDARKPARRTFARNIARLQTFVRRNRFDPLLVRRLDWLLLLLVVGISLFGVVCIFAATGVPTDTPATSVMEVLSTQPLNYARLQLLWLIIGLLALSATLYFS